MPAAACCALTWLNHPATGLCGKTVIGVRIPMDKDGKARGICFVDFNSKAAAEKGLKKSKTRQRPLQQQEPQNSS